MSSFRSMSVRFEQVMAVEEHLQFIAVGKFTYLAIHRPGRMVER